MKIVLCLSSTLLTDRILRHGSFLKHLSAAASPVVWSTAPSFPSEIAWEPFPTVKEMGFRYQLARRIIDYSFDSGNPSSSRASFWNLRRVSELPAYHRTLRSCGRIVHAARMESSSERLLERLLIREPRSPDAFARLKRLRPAAVLATSPFRRDEPGIVAAAKAQSIPTVAFITSWDNLTTKSRLIFEYDAYMVYSEQMKNELARLYPSARNKPVYVIGGPQFDLLFDAHFYQSKQHFCNLHGLDPSLPIVVYGLGSPNLIREYHGAIDFCQRVQCGELGAVQVIVRPHPLFRHRMGELDPLTRMGKRIVLQDPGISGATQSATEAALWVNTFRHADVVVNLSSTITIDAALFDRPIVNLDFDPEPSAPNQHLVKDINHVWEHFRPIAESGGVRLAATMTEVVAAVKTYLASPQLDREARRWMAEYVCGFTDGRCGVRMSRAMQSILDGLSILRPGKRALGHG